MKIILSNYRYFVSGGPERYMFHIENYLRKMGHEVFPFSVKSKNNQPCETEKFFISPISKHGDYFRQYGLHPHALWKTIWRQLYSPEAFLKARAFAKVCRPDVVYALPYLNKMSPSVLDGFKSVGVPVVHRVSDFGLICPQAHFFDGENPCTKCLDGNYFHAVGTRCIAGSRSAGMAKALALSLHRLLKCNDRIDALVFPSKFTLQKFQEAGFPAEKLHYLPTAVETASITPTYAQGSDILYFGRVTPEKGIGRLLAAYRKVKGDKPRLVVVGLQSLTPYERALTEEYPEVEFHQFCSDSELGEFMKRAFCVVVPSAWYENLPNTLLEAYAHGKSVIAPNHGCFGDFIENGKTGLEFVHGDTDDLSEKLSWAVAHRAEMQGMGRNARAMVETMASPERHYETLMSVFKSVL